MGSATRSVRPKLWLIVVCLACGSVLLAQQGRAANGNGPATEGIRDPNTIHCPAAPPGWFIDVNADGVGIGREIKNPMTDSTLQGEDIVLVTCDYFARVGPLRHVLVNVAYALPFDVNPIYDFYYGCGSSGTKWNATDRVYRVTSVDQWAIATFYDADLDVRANEVPGFEAVTDGLLKNTEGYAHPCSLRSIPSDVPSNFSYTFSSDAGQGVGSFIVTGVAPETGWVPIKSVTFHRFGLKFGGEKLTVAIDHGIRFFPATLYQRGKLILAIRIVSTNVLSCEPKDTGTLTLTDTSLVVGVCGESFSAGQITGHIVFL